MTLTDIIANAQTKKIPDEDFINEIWETTLLTYEKVILSLELFDIQPTYHVLTNMWSGYFFTTDVSREINDIIFRHYQALLSDSNIDLENSMQYSLYFDIFEEPLIHREAWQFLLRNSPSEEFIKIMLCNSGPVPFDLKFA